jgi:hypothetical protein
MTHKYISIPLFLFHTPPLFFVPHPFLLLSRQNETTLRSNVTSSRQAMTSSCQVTGTTWKILIGPKITYIFSQYHHSICNVGRVAVSSPTRC